MQWRLDDQFGDELFYSHNCYIQKEWPSDNKRTTLPDYNHSLDCNFWIKLVEGSTNCTVLSHHLREEKKHAINEFEVWLYF